MKITKQLAHVMQDSNLFIHEVEETATKSQYVGRFTIDGQHPYLYENPAIANHISGTTFLDVCRQLLKAIAHLYYEAPIENRFVIRNVQMDFGRWTKLNVPIEVVVDITHQIVKIRGQDCINYSAQVNFYQEGRLTTAMTGQYSTFPAAIEELLMGRQYRQAPVAAAPCQRAV